MWAGSEVASGVIGTSEAASWFDVEFCQSDSLRESQKENGAGLPSIAGMTWGVVCHYLFSPLFMQGCEVSVVEKLKAKLRDDALNAGSFNAPMLDGTVVQLPHMPLLPFCDAFQ